MTGYASMQFDYVVSEECASLKSLEGSSIDLSVFKAMTTI